MDYSKLSDADLTALEANNLAEMSDEGLTFLEAGSVPQKPTAPKPHVGIVTKAVRAVGEPLVTMGSGLLAQPMSWAAGGYKSLFGEKEAERKEGDGPGFLFERTGSRNAKRVADAVAKRFTYEPRTPEGKGAMEVIGYLPEKYAELTRGAGNQVEQMTGSPLVGDVTQTALDAVPMVAGVPIAKAAIAPFARTAQNMNVGIRDAVRQHLTPDGMVQKGLRERIKADPVGILADLDAAMPGDTAGHAVGRNPKAVDLAALQAKTEKVEGIAPDFVAQAYKREAAQKKDIGGIGGSRTDIDSATRQRTDATERLYRFVKMDKEPINIGGTIDRVDDLIRRNAGNPTMFAVLSDVKKALVRSNERIDLKKAEELGLKKGDPNLPLLPNAEQVASAIDGLKIAIDDSKNANIQSKLIGIKQDLEQQLGGYAEAQEAFASESVDLNRMKVGNVLDDALGAGEKNFLNAFKDVEGTLKKAKLDGRFDTLESVLSPEQSATVARVAEELSRKEAYGKLSGHAEKTEVKAREYLTSAIPNFYRSEFPIVKWVGNYIANKFVQPKINAKVSHLLRNPTEISEFLAKKSEARDGVVAALMKNRILPASSSASTIATLKGQSKPDSLN